MRQVPEVSEVRRLRKTIMLLVLLLGILGLIPSARAAVPVPFSGTFTGGFTVTDVRLADGNTLFTILNSIQFAGDFSGVCVAQGELLIVHPTGGDNFETACTFPAAILGNTGTVTLSFTGAGQGASFHGFFVLSRGTDGLENLNAAQGVFNGAFTGPTTFAGSLSGQLLFAPT